MIKIENPEDLHHNAVNLSGQKQGGLTFLLPTTEREGAGGNILWLCYCECGGFTVIPSHSRSKSCGCKQHVRQYNDISGEQFGRLTALEPIRENHEWHMKWRCVCDCGNEAEVYYNNLTQGSTQSCGCLQKEITSKRASRNTGSSNPNWKGGISSKRMLIRSSKQYSEWRNGVFDRDGYTCQKCDTEGSERYLEAHHILPFAIHPEYRFDVDNGSTLCESCHKSFHQEYGRKYCDPLNFRMWLNAD